ncbi:MAG: protein kinase [Fimbriiglobus sp.]|nr:protein kinase [Fimbriiglobus sp.]
MYCGERLKAVAVDETIIRPVQPSPVSQLLSDVPEDHADYDTTRTGHGDPSSVDPPTRDAAPARVGGYRLVKALGSGGMGQVYEAEDPNTGTRVAVKLLSRRLSTNPASVERFRQEGRLASQLTHPRCVFVLRADTDNGRPFIVMELMPGRTLKDEVDDRGPLPVAEAVEYMLDVIDGLIEAHRLGVIHRDVKPSNCFLTADGRVKVGDFGLSKSLAGDTTKQLTHSGTFLGTVLFAPPEQIKHEPVGYDSDVYSVAATLYYLLMGQAPHQHESLTAVLAKAISEPAPPLRPKRPEVSAELERAVLKGLERDRTRRFQSLEEFRDALTDVLPKNQAPAGVRSLVLAYFIDLVLGYFVLLPVEFLRTLLMPELSQEQTQLASMAVNGLFHLLYFTLFDGLFGATPGKMLFRLRVRRVGRTDPPGLLWGLVRAAVFQAIWFVPTLIAILAAWSLGQFMLWVLFSPIGWAISAAVLLPQLRRTTLGHRGVHDFVAGTRVIQKRPPARRSRLVSAHPNPLDRIATTSVPLPECVGLFKIVGKLCDVDDGGQVWVGEDESLGRRVIVRVEPPGAGDDSRFDDPVVRPARLRAVGHGTVEWGGGERAWVAFVAPVGAPLTDVVSEQKRLNWADARGVLEQLTAELIDGERDGTAPPVVTPDQVWVEPSGRVQVLDFPLPTGTAAAAGETRTRYPSGTADPFQFLRRVTTLMLEGRPRTSDEPVAAPLPAKAEAITTDLMEDRFHELPEFQKALHDNRQLPPEVTTGMRAGHLSATAVMCGGWLFLMFILSGIVSWGIAFGMSMEAIQREELLASLDTPEKRKEWITTVRRQASNESEKRDAERFERLFSEERADRTLRLLRREVVVRQAYQADAEKRLNPVERSLLRGMITQVTQTRQFNLGPSIRNYLSRVEQQEQGEHTVGGKEFDATGEMASDHVENTDKLDDVTRIAGIVMGCVIAQWPLVWFPLFALVFRGGIARWIAGVAFDRHDGRPASRWVCGLRSLLTWLPLLLVLWGAIALQVWLPTWVYLRTLLWLGGFVVLGLMAFLALRRPDQTPLDRLFRLSIVPA